MKFSKEVVHVKLDTISPNPWNPNEMSPDTWAMFRQGIVNDGWIASQSLLVWATDEKGKKKNLIIDGEHRYRAALELGHETAPVVYVHGATRAQAQALTIRLNAKRGEFDTDAIGDLIRALVQETHTGNLAHELGFTDEDFSRYLSPPIPVPPEPSAEGGEDPEPEEEDEKPPIQVGTLQLFFTKEKSFAYLELESLAMGRLGCTKGYETLREACLRILND